MQATGGPPEKSVTDLLGELAGETAALVKHEVALATHETAEKLKVVARQIVYVAIALLVATAALLSLVASLIIGLSAYVPAWISALAVGLGLSIVAWLLYQKTVTTLANVEVAPKRTLETLKNTKDWMQEQTR